MIIFKQLIKNLADNEKASNRRALEIILNKRLAGILVENKIRKENIQDIVYVLNGKSVARNQVGLYLKDTTLLSKGP